jgi:excisionase family DNA binding protein
LLTIKDVAERLRVTPSTVYKLITDGKLRSFKVGNRYRINEADLEKYMEESIEAIRANRTSQTN